MAETYKLTYFNLKAVGEPIRLLFAYAGVPYEDNRLERDTWPEHKRDYPWGQLPVLQIGDKTLAQSNAILRYLGRKFNLGGTNDWEAAKIDELADVVADFRGAWGPIVREQDPAKKAELQKTFAETTVPTILKNLENVIAKNTGSVYLVGKNLTWVDLLVAHYLDMIVSTTAPGALEHFPNLSKLTKTVFSIPQIKAWVEKRPKTQI